ncbi:MAG: hypothetical protein U0361_03205 [Nitrospiraceae bacterium]
MRSYLPVVEIEPTAPCSKALEKAAESLLQILARPLPPETTPAESEAKADAPVAPSAPAA